MNKKSFYFVIVIFALSSCKANNDILDMINLPQDYTLFKNEIFSRGFRFSKRYQPSPVDYGIIENERYNITYYPKKDNKIPWYGIFNEEKLMGKPHFSEILIKKIKEEYGKPKNINYIDISDIEEFWRGQDVMFWDLEDRYIYSAIKIYPGENEKHEYIYILYK